MKIKLNKNQSVSSIEQDKTIPLDLKRTQGLVFYRDIINNVNAQNVFNEERLQCNKYRLILTINPYCTNVLFNSFTEIINNEGSEDVKIYVDGDDEPTSDNLGNGRTYYLQNTILNNNVKKWDYHCGYDIFNNHILRDVSFKIVSKTNSNVQNGVFNTIIDNMRDSDGNNIKHYNRWYDNNNGEFLIKTLLSKKLYTKDDILQFSDGSAINNRLIEEDGWFGFENVTQIKTKDKTKDIKIDKVINSKNAGDFIDMYPDRSLYSFKNKYNSFKDRDEKNWDICLTYPYANYKEHNLCKCYIDGKQTTALKILKIVKTKNTHGGEVLLFYTYTKHGLTDGDCIRLLVSKDDDLINAQYSYEILNNNIMISHVGDLAYENKEYIFTVENMSFLEYMSSYIMGDDNDDSWMYDEDGNYNDDNITNKLNSLYFRFNRMKGSTPSEYYIRILKKIPNLKFKKELLTNEIVADNSLYSDYLNNNSIDNFSSEYGSLSFATTIYGEQNVQFVYNDEIDLTNITDNLGRPVSEFYVTILKTNKGNDIWYNKNNWIIDKDNNTATLKDQIDTDKIEYSHCFSNLTAGYVFHNGEIKDKTIQAQLGDIRLMNNLNVFKSKPITYREYGKNITSEGFKGYITKHGASNILIEENDLYSTEMDGLFFGDFIDFNPSDAIEHILNDAMYRFNTQQREYNDYDTMLYNKFYGIDIITDDYDIPDTSQDTGFNVEIYNYTSKDCTYKTNDGSELYSFQKPEGYYYKPHYNIPIKSFGSLKQSHHEEILIQSAIPIQSNGIFIKITTKMRSNCKSGDIIFVCDDENGIWYKTEVVYVINRLSFYINHQLINTSNNKPINKSWLNTCELINNGRYSIRRMNVEIPNYAFRIGNNQFLWRNIINIGEVSSTLPEYLFTNNTFYINKKVDFFLKRQDPHKNNSVGLYTGNIANSFPQDVAGISTIASNYEYKEESEMKC